MTGGKTDLNIKTIIGQFQQQNVSETFANFSLIIIFPALFFYQTALGMRLIEPVIGSGWAFSMIILFPCLGFFYLLKIIYENDSIFFLEYLFIAFLGLILAVSLINYMFPLPLQHNGYVLDWNVSGVVSNATCFMAFRLANVSRPSFLLLFKICGVLVVLAVYLNVNLEISYFGFVRGEQIMTYQGFARLMMFTFFILVLSEKNRYAMVSLYLLFSLILVVSQSRTEFIVFAASIPAILFFKNSIRVKLEIASLSLFVLFILFFLKSFFPDFFAQALNYIAITRIGYLGDIYSDGSFILRMAQTSKAISTIIENPIFGAYGSYFLNTGEPGNYSHTILAVWVNLGLLGFLLYCLLNIMVLRFCLSNKKPHKNSYSVYLAGALGLSAVVAHTFSYVYVEILLACAIGTIARTCAEERDYIPKSER